MNWQPIETAPKDGTFVLLWLRAPYSVADVLRWEASVEGWVSAHWDAQAEGFCGSLVPSHWMPIVPPGVKAAPIRPATDEEVLEWAKRHDLPCWDHITEARAAFEDAETHHMTRADGVEGRKP